MFATFLSGIQEPKMVKAWYMVDIAEDADCRKQWKLEPEGENEVSLKQLEGLGVLYWKLNPDLIEADPALEGIRKERGYSYTDFVHIAPDKLPDYEKKLRIFFTEHLHTDEEIRYCLDGTGYFDVRSKDDRWIRVAVERGDMLVLPAGIFHRFTIDESNYGRFMRLFVGDPVWTPYNRQTPDLPPQVDEARRAYAGLLERLSASGLAA